MEKANFRIGMTATEVVAEIAIIYYDAIFRFYVYQPHYNKREIKKKNLLIDDLLFHDQPTRMTEIEGRKITTAALNKKISKLKEDEVLSILSLLQAKDEGARSGFSVPFNFHIPLMDFDCPESPENLAKIKYFLKKVGQKEGVILASGRSYHYYGSKLLTHQDWENFLGDCLLSGFVETRYAGHRLKDHECVLRLSACPLRPKIPTVVSILEG